MAEVILMPRLSDTMTEGVIAAWHKKVGDKVKKGDLLAEIETDKATMELESYKDGTLLHIGGDKGAKIQVDDLLAILGNPGEDVSGLVKGKPAGAAAQPDTSKPVAKETDTADKAEGDIPTGGQGSSSSMDLSKMEEVVLMPRLSDTMTEGVIAAWHKKVGDTVKKGDV
ncbi:MAG TPA: biotin/lipoyl-containing protein, partial [Flavisolibacter sp.]